jgi:outer membrane protein OmpA-like peptidoglycan-associated protein
MYSQAYGLLMKNVLDSCDELNMLLAKSKVLAANGAYSEAEKVLTELIDAHPDNPKLQAEQRRQDYLKLLDENLPPVEITPYGSGHMGNEMIAWSDSALPVVIAEQIKVTSYFPRKEVGVAGYDFRESDMALVEESSKKFTHLIQRQGYAQIGPGTAYKDSLLLYTASDPKPFSAKAKDAPLSIYQVKSGSGMKRPEMLSLSAAEADNAFPTYVEHQKAIIFSSNRDGGMGGMDLYKSEYKNGNWSKPENLGKSINTREDELYPEVSGDTLFFTSNRSDLGYGGMDLYGYCFSNDSLWNLGFPVNTFSNDFRIVFASPQKAFMISDRPGLVSGDRIYQLKYENPELYFEGISARADWPDGAIGKKVTLINSKTGAQQTAIIESDGIVNFRNVKGESDYELAVDGMLLPEGFELNLYNHDGKLIKELRSNADGKFRFVLLTPYDYRLKRFDNEDESILRVDILGKVNADPVPEEGFRIILLDSLGNTIGSTYTTDNGAFAFKAVIPNDSYIIKSEVLDANNTIHILDEQGNVINTITPNDANEYVYVRLGANDRIVTLTNELKQKVKISDQDQFNIGSIYFDLNAYELDEQATPALNKLITILKNNAHVNVELSGHTDSRGSATYNLKLSQLRIEAVMRHLNNGGIQSDRILGKGYGESNLKNDCSDGVSCSEEQHAENRRTEFRIYETETNQ